MTISDIAKMAGVSSAAVSRYLAGDLPHRLGADAGHDDPHLTHLAGAQGLGGSIRAITGFFHYGLYHGALQDCRVPVVVTGQRFADLPCVYNDDRSAARDLTRNVTQTTPSNCGQRASSSSMQRCPSSMEKAAQ